MRLAGASVELEAEVTALCSRLYMLWLQYAQMPEESSLGAAAAADQHLGETTPLDLILRMTL